METVWAAAPLVMAIGVLLVWRWPATRAAGLGCGLALALAGWHPAYAVTPAALGGALLAGLVTTLAVVSVVYGGLVLFQVTQLGGAIQRIAAGLAGLGADRPALALTLVLGLAPFVEAASGFGVGAAVTCPLLLALGFPRRRAILLALLGLCTVPWGALAVGTILGAGLTGLPLATLGAATALLNAPLLVFVGLLAGGLAGGRAAWRRWPLGAALVTTQVAGLWAISRWVSVELAGLAAGLAALGLGSAWLLAERGRGIGGTEEPPRPQGRQDDAKTTDGAMGSEGGMARSTPRSVLGPPPSVRSLSLPRAVLPYLLLVLLLLVTRLLGPAREALDAVAVLTTPDGAARLPLLASPATWLLLAALGGAAILRLAPPTVVKALVGAGRQWWRPALGTAGFVALGQIMQATGMTAALARALAGLGPAYLVAAAPLAGLAGFVTGSNAGANAMLAVLGVEAASQVGLSPVLVLAMQNAAAATVTLASPARMLLVLAVAGLTAQERPAEETAVARRLLVIAAALLALLALTGALLLALPSSSGAAF